MPSEGSSSDQKNVLSKLLLVISNSTLLNELHDGNIITISKN